MSLAEIQEAVINLPEKEKAKLIDVLWDSLSSPDQKAREAAWAEESERRIDAFESGSLTAREAALVFDDLRKDLRK
jgi:putative addiction module component (TIGR02574 family)